ncbi:hypothetical protein CO151_03945 [bacterium CG_4_9_14_3_um_filter_65_15]|nr:MAG: hypothetical protein CO151_03945 [bacterium CG_4_9_14_3_um_filter_65_15]
MDPSTVNLDPQSPFMIERMLRLWRLGMDEAETFASEDEFRVVLQEVEHAELAKNYSALVRKRPGEMAQELAFQAYDALSGEEALAFAEQALEGDPRCVDALVIRAFLTAEDMGELIPLLQHAATCGEEDLGEDFFAEFMGDFWPMVEARPYMRCIKQLAEVLWNVGRRLDAVAHYENLMDLDPEDHMGNGALLLGNYLAMGEVQRTWDLLEEIDDEEGAVYNWAWVLVFLLVGDEEGAREAVDHALDVNAYVAPLLIGMGEDEDAELVTPAEALTGTKEEARYCLQVLGEAWSVHPTAHWWLLDVLRAMGLVTDADAPGEIE